LAHAISSPAESLTIDPPDKSDVEVACLGMVEDDRRGALLGPELVLVERLGPDPGGAEHRQQLGLLGEVTQEG
jgi:hypothetical protein